MKSVRSLRGPALLVGILITSTGSADDLRVSPSRHIPDCPGTCNLIFSPDVVEPTGDYVTFEVSIDPVLAQVDYADVLIGLDFPIVEFVWGSPFANEFAPLIDAFGLYTHDVFLSAGGPGPYSTPITLGELTVDVTAAERR